MYIFLSKRGMCPTVGIKLNIVLATAEIWELKYHMEKVTHTKMKSGPKKLQWLP